MAIVDVVNQQNKKVGSLELRDDVFAVKVNVPLVHQVIKAQLADRRQGTAKTKVKSEVRGGGRKPFRQKGTGNARQGSTRSPLHPGGGQNFGPQPRSYAQRTPKEMMRGALRSALSDRLSSKRLMVVDEFSLDAPKTRTMVEILKKNLALDRVLVISDANAKLERAARNIPHVRVLRTEGVNVYDVVKYGWVVFTKSAIQSVEKRLAPEATSAKAK